MITWSRLRLGGLTSGTEYAFRVAAVGAAGQSQWSGLVTKFVG